MRADGSAAQMYGRVELTPAEFEAWLAKMWSDHISAVYGSHTQVDKVA